MNALRAFYDDYRVRAETLPGAGLPWVRKVRELAAERLVAQGLPSRRDEAWRYTDVTLIAKRRFHPATIVGDLAKDCLSPYSPPALSTHRLVFVNGRFDPVLSDTNGLPVGVTAISLARAMDERPDILKAHLGRRSNDMNTHVFTALNETFMNDGAVVHIGRDVVVEQPIELMFLSQGSNVAAYPRNLIVAEKNSRATIIETYAGLEDGEYLTDSVTEIALEPGAVLEHYKLGLEQASAFAISGLYVRQSRDSRYTSHNITLGGRLVRNDIHTILDAEGAQCELNGLSVTHGRQHVDNQTRIDHRCRNSTSREWYKGVLDGNSKVVFSGRVVVHEGAQHTDARQANNNLLLSHNAEADSMPQLEIYADDVKCAHGATVGTLDDDALFYLCARGIDKADARSMLVSAFTEEVLSRMGFEAVRTFLEARLKHKALAKEDAK